MDEEEQGNGVFRSKAKSIYNFIKIHSLIDYWTYANVVDKATIYNVKINKSVFYRRYEMPVIATGVAGRTTTTI